jgi:LysR family cys regulon transcriptional activator
MKLQQLRAVHAVAQCDLNVTAAAVQLHATQPAVSKQLQALEAELGFNLFVRRGRTLTRMTPAALRILPFLQRLLQEERNIRRVSAESRGDSSGTMVIGTTHTQARYALPNTIREFRRAHPQIKIELHQGTTEQIAQMVRLGQIDFAIATGSRECFGDYVLLPCYQWYPSFLVPKGHPLAKASRPRLEQVAAHPLVTYAFSFTGSASLPEIFDAAGVAPNIVLTAQDADVIKTYVRLGFGVGIIANVAVEPGDHVALVAISGRHLFPTQTTWIGFPGEGFLRRYMYDFVRLFAPHLTHRWIERASHCRNQAEVEGLFEGVVLPDHATPT